MYPVYQFSDSYPHQRNQMHAAPCYYPCFEAFPPMMRANPDGFYPQFWSQSGNYGKAYPGQGDGCCNYNPFSGYFDFHPPCGRPPFPYYSGSYNVPPGSYPTQCIPPPFSTMGLPRYEYYKGMPSHHHCCGCPNHPCNQRDPKDVKIEEDDPHPEKKEDVSSVPNNLKNYPYPIVWFPPNYFNHKEATKSKEPQFHKQGEYTAGAESSHEMSKPSGPQPNFLSGWFPIDIENYRSLMHGADSLKKQQNLDDGNSCLSWPPFWMPYKPDLQTEGMKHKRTNFSQECPQIAPAQYEVRPGLVPDAEDKNSSKLNEEISGQEDPKTTEKNNVQKIIPVKQAEPKEERITLENNAQEKAKGSEDDGKRKSQSPPKSSRLPPVCLRVDPLPRKKNPNGSSRSPSPPGHKKNMCELSKDTNKPTAVPNAHEISQQEITGKHLAERNKDEEQHKSKTKTFEVYEGTIAQGKGNLGAVHVDNCNILPVDSCKDAVSTETSHKPREVCAEIADTDVKYESAAEDKTDQTTMGDKSIHRSSQQNEGEEKIKAEEQTPDKSKECEKINLSEAEAAHIIQSAYRGYQVRRWEPLEKLKQIGKVREKVTEIKSRIQSMESSTDIEVDDKLKTIMGETIMNLLLKLDTIQGLHPSIRDVRKSVVRELVSLQQKIDCFSLKKNGTSIEQLSTAESGEETEIRDTLCVQEGQERQKIGQENIQSEIHCANELHPEEPTEGECCLVLDARANSKSCEILEAERDKEDADENPQEPIAASLRDGVTESEKNIACTQNGEEMISQPLSGDEVSHLRELENFPKGVLDKDNSLGANNLVQNEHVEDQGLQDEVLTGTASGVNGLAELVHGELGDDGNQESNKHMHVGKEDHEVPTHEVTVEVNAEVPKGEVFNMNQAEQSDEMTLALPVNLEVSDSFGPEETEASNVELFRNVDVGSHDIQTQTPEGETSFITNLVDACEMDGKDGVEVNAKVPKGEILNMNQAKQSDEMTHAMPVNLDVSDSFELDENKANNVEPLGKVDVGSHDIQLQTPEEETSFITKLVDTCEMDGKDGRAMDAEVFGFSRIESDECEQMESPAMRYAIEPIEDYKACEEVANEFPFTQGEYVSVWENGVTDADNSSAGRDLLTATATQEYDFPTESTKSNDVEHDQNLVNEKLQVLASEVATGDPCDPAGLEDVMVDRQLPVSLESKQTEEEEGNLSSSPANTSQVTCESDAFTKSDEKLIEENGKLREMMQKLIEAGKEQLTAISNLSGRVKDLEKRLSRKKKLKMSRTSTSHSTPRSSYLKPSNDPLKERAVPLAI